MSKLFDTNYHYLCPELEPDLKPTPDWEPLLDRVRRGQAVVGKTRAVPILIGKGKPCLRGDPRASIWSSTSQLIAHPSPAILQAGEQDYLCGQFCWLMLLRCVSAPCPHPP